LPHQTLKPGYGPAADKGKLYSVARQSCQRGIFAMVLKLSLHHL